uniref:60S ribosomal protein L7-1 n=1 Tax=Aegilops tauschii TaxID=37682 RepID=M8CEA9_AEGTA
MQPRRHDAKCAIKHPEVFVKEFRNKELDFLRMRTRLKILARLQLKKVLTGVFLKATEANLKRLATVGPFVTYGRFPNLKNVKELIYKKGRGYFDKEPFPLTSNDLIEKRQEEEKTAINTHVLNKNVVLASLLRQLFSGASEGVMTISAVSTPDAGQMCCAGQQGFGICCFSMCGLIPLNLIAQASMILRSLFAICFL